VQTVAFGPLAVRYDTRVLVPRAWTLAQSVWAAELCAELPPGPILEFFAGAGHIGLAAAVLAERDLVQVELDPVAAQYARENAASAGRAPRTQVRECDVQDALRPDETFSLIVADPPYLPSAALALWPHDPPRAIDGGADGLQVVRACLEVSARHLRPGGVLLLQLAGAGQAGRVADLLAAETHWQLRAGECRSVDEERAILRVDRA
jgi:release factor glutamine methyltransferase